MVPSYPAACHASLAALTLPWGWSWRSSFRKLVLPGETIAVLGILGADFSLAAVLEFPRRLPLSPICDLILWMRVEPIVPSFPAAAHASFTALTLPCGWSPRKSFTNLVLPWSLVAVLGILGADFSLADFLVFPGRLPVSPSSFRTWLMMGWLIVPSNPAACQASFTVLVVPSGWSLRNCLTKLVLPGVAVAVVAMRSTPGWFKPRPVSTERQNAVYGQRNSHEFQGRVESSLG